MGRYADADFIGEVISRRVMPANDKFQFLNVLFEVRVTESFRGSQKQGETVSIRTGFGGGDCGYRFAIGSRYLIDAWKKDGIFLTGICSLTAPVDDSEVELRSLRRIALGQRPPDLTGVLMRGTETRSGENFAALPNITVAARKKAGGENQKTITDPIGSFTFERVPKGIYELILGLPGNLSPAYANFAILDEDQLPPISINSNDDDSAACHVEIVVEPSASISGVVQSSHGAPIDGWVNADSVTKDDKPWGTVRTVTLGSDGKFFLGHLKPGRYSVQFTNRAGFVPGTRQIIELRDGERRTRVVLLSHQ